MCKSGEPAAGKPAHRRSLPFETNSFAADFRRAARIRRESDESILGFAKSDATADTVYSFHPYHIGRTRDALGEGACGSPGACFIRIAVRA
jgi:hypothetical protein